MHSIKTFSVLNDPIRRSIKQSIANKNGITIANSGLAKTLFDTLLRICTLGLYDCHNMSRDSHEFDFYKKNIGAVRNGLVQLKNSDKWQVKIQLSNEETATLTKNGQFVCFKVGETGESVNINYDINTIIARIDNDVEENGARYSDAFVAALKLSKIADSMIPIEPPGPDEINMPAYIPGDELEKRELLANFKEIARNLGRCIQEELATAGYYRKPISNLKAMFQKHATKHLDTILTGGINKGNWQKHQEVFDTLAELSTSQRLAILGDNDTMKFNLIASYFKSIQTSAKNDHVNPIVPVGVSLIDKIFYDAIKVGLTKDKKKDFVLALQIVRKAKVLRSKPLCDSYFLCGFANYHYANNKNANFDKLNFDKLVLSGGHFIATAVNIAEKINSLRFIKNFNGIDEEVPLKDLGGGIEHYVDELVKYFYYNPEIYKDLTNVATDKDLCKFIEDHAIELGIDKQDLCYTTAAVAFWGYCKTTPLERIEDVITKAVSTTYPVTYSIYPKDPPTREAITEAGIGRPNVPPAPERVAVPGIGDRDNIPPGQGGIGQPEIHGGGDIPPGRSQGVPSGPEVATQPAIGSGDGVPPGQRQIEPPGQQVLKRLEEETEIDEGDGSGIPNAPSAYFDDLLASEELSNEPI